MSKSQFLYLTTTGWKTGNRHRIEIWFVEYDERYYIISERLERAHWVQNIKHNPKVSFSINENVFKGTARIVDQVKESALAREVSKLMNTKYKWSQGLIVELIPVNST
ncbi:MAG: nitroreductase family deazaflavin-dependent oxidoreductase [Thermoproteota archaeon]|nr:nitroreductase family deazaflavin-dependent oxidoreductase [Thermoproteota archaeon]